MAKRKSLNQTNKITKEDQYKMHRKARREADIEFQTPRLHHSAHKSIKDYSRKNKSWKKEI